MQYLTLIILLSESSAQKTQTFYNVAGVLQPLSQESWDIMYCINKNRKNTHIWNVKSEAFYNLIKTIS